MPAAATTSRWDDLPADHPIDLIDRRRVIGERCMISHLTLYKGFAVPVHSHENEQFSVVLSGLLRFTVEEEPGGSRTIDVGPGEVIHLPSRLPHGAEAVETCVVLDIFSPPSEATGVDAG